MHDQSGGELKRFGISAERGFLAEPDPLLALPAAFGAWEELGRDLPKLLLAGRVRGALDALPTIDPSALVSECEARRAMRLLSYFGHAYVWGGASPAPRIPAGVAGPWVAVARRLGRPPVLSYASYALDNWRRLDAGGPLELGNLAILQSFLGGADEDWFILVHVEIEALAAPGLRALLLARAAAAAGDVAELEAQLARLAAALERIASALLRMPDWCDPYVYYQRVRPWIFGWKDHPALPHGVVYEGEFGGEPRRFRGETGAQSAIVPALDAALGVAHRDDPLRAYLLEMRDYMPPRHREFVEELERGASIRDCIAKHREGHPALLEAYDACLHWLEVFRGQHLEYAARYIQRQSQASASNPTAVGTGGTPFMPYLRKHRDETASARLGRA
jgi:indoleamine 2,3-dioxygenase